MRLDDLRKWLRGDGGLIVQPEDQCPYSGCQNRAQVPDDKQMWCSEHHFRCETNAYGQACNGRVRVLGEVCSVCQKDPKRKQYARNFFLNGRSRRR